MKPLFTGWYCPKDCDRPRAHVSGVVESFNQLGFETGPVEKRDDFILPPPKRLIAQASDTMRSLGLTWQSAELLGQRLVFATVSGPSRYLERSKLYSLNADALDAVVRHCEYLHKKHGPGRVWFLDTPVHPVMDDGFVAGKSAPTGFQTLWRTVYGHEAQIKAL
jgi:hypothetical protein